MADEGSGSRSGSGLFWGSLVFIGVLLLTVPLASEILFQWIPATISVLSGEGAPAVDTVHSGADTPVVVLTSNIETVGGALSSARDGSSGFFNEEMFNMWRVFVPISIFVSLLLATGVAYSIIRVFQIRAHERAQHARVQKPIAGGEQTAAQLRWGRIKQEIASESPEKWRMAILEADIMLDELLDVQGYRGETMGEKMKQVERADFNTIEDAWDAHKVRNRIAHEGNMHELNQRKVQRVIGLYENVFREFHFI